MTSRPIIQWPDKRLRTPANAVPEITDEVRQIWQDMIDTMDAMPGVGLAAPHSLRFVQHLAFGTAVMRRSRPTMRTSLILRSMRSRMCSKPGNRNNPRAPSKKKSNNNNKRSTRSNRRSTRS